MLFTVLTTIQPPTSSVRILAKCLGGHARLVVAGDTKGPTEFKLTDVGDFAADNLTLLTVEAQLGSGFRLAKLLPTKHYARKNVGYLYAIRAGASCVYETDDDNAPLDTWQPRSEHLSRLPYVHSSTTKRPAWVNVYKHFSKESIWPRGLPLDQIHCKSCSQSSGDTSGTSEARWAPIQQGLANGAPDVDAIWRLTMDREFRFDNNPSIMLPPGQWCPFNTQSTWWWPAVYPLLYVPSYCSFRMCDIWKSFVAQRCLWELGTGVVFHAPEVWQERNFHDLMKDFTDEIPGYQENDRIAQTLEALELSRGTESVADNLHFCYRHLIQAGIFPKSELKLVEAWLADIEAVTCKAPLIR